VKRVSWVMRIAFPLVAAIATAGAITSAPAIAASNQANNTPPRTCHTWRVLYGAWDAIDSYTNRGLAWTTAGAEGSPIYLGSYTGSLNQCWELLGGFGNGEVEFSLADSPMCIRVYNGDTNAGAYMEDWPCLSQTSELFKTLADGSRIMFENVKSHLCITGDSGIVSGATLDQEGCSNYGSSQSWRLNTSP
jgi:hypothetical protein